MKGQWIWSSFLVKLCWIWLENIKTVINQKIARRQNVFISLVVSQPLSSAFSDVISSDIYDFVDFTMFFPSRNYLWSDLSSQNHFHRQQQQHGFRQLSCVSQTSRTTLRGNWFEFEMCEKFLNLFPTPPRDSGGFVIETSGGFALFCRVLHITTTAALVIMIIFCI